MIDAVIWWTGAAVMASGGAYAAASLVAAVSVAAVALADHHARRLGNLGANLRAVREWHLAGRPVRELGADAEWHWRLTGERAE